MSDEIIHRLAEKAARDIEKDLRDRRGIRHEWDRIDLDIQAEIWATMNDIIARHFSPFAELLAAAEHGLRTLENHSEEEAVRTGSTKELCDYTGAKSLRNAIAAVKKETGQCV